MASTMIRQVTLVGLRCASCGMEFAIPDWFMQDRRNDHQSFYCPKQHLNYYPEKSALDLANDALVEEKHLREQAEARAASRAERLAEQHRETARVARRLSATQGVVTRHKKKIAAGRCPCCSTTFKDLATHMKTRHPKWDPTKEVEATA